MTCRFCKLYRTISNSNIVFMHKYDIIILFKEMVVNHKKRERMAVPSLLHYVLPPKEVNELLLNFFNYQIEHYHCNDNVDVYCHIV